MRIYLAVLLLAATCAHAQARLVGIDFSQRPPEDWPKLDESIQRGTFDDIKRWCGAPSEVADRVIGCSKINFEYRLCMIFVSTETSELLTHERAHCAGYGHVGEMNQHGAAWEKFKRTGK